MNVKDFRNFPYWGVRIINQGTKKGGKENLKTYITECKEEDYYLGLDFSNLFNGKLSLEELLDFNDYFANIGIPHYYYRPESFYESMGIDLKKLKRIFIENRLDDLFEYMIYVAWEYKTYQKEEKQSQSDDIEFINSAKILSYLRKSPIEKVSISIHSNTKGTYSTSDRNIVQKIWDYLEIIHQVETDESGFIENIKITNSGLDYLIKRGITIRKKKRGAPFKNTRIASFVELLLYIINYGKSKNENPHTFKGFSNSNLRFIYEFLKFFDLIKKGTTSKSNNIGTSHNYMRMLIVNLRTQRLKYKIK